MKSGVAVVMWLVGLTVMLYISVPPFVRRLKSRAPDVFLALGQPELTASDTRLTVGGVVRVIVAIESLTYVGSLSRKRTASALTHFCRQPCAAREKKRAVRNAPVDMRV